MSAEDEQFAGMDETCPACGGVVGEHTLRSFTACMAQRGEVSNFDYRDVQPQDTLTHLMNDLRARFGIGGDVLIADHVICKSSVMRGASGPLQMVSPCVLFEFATALPAGPATVAKVLYITPTPTEARRFGKLVHDTANGAANAALRMRAAASKNGPGGR